MTDLYIDGFAAVAPCAGPALAESPLDRVAPARRGAVWLGGASATALHLVLAGAAGWVATTSTSTSSLQPARVTQMVEVPVELEPPPAPVPAAEPEVAPAKVVAPHAPAAPPAATRAAPAAAQASEVLAQEPVAEEIVDFGETFVQGTAVTYAGGISAATGSSREAVRDPGASAHGRVGGTGTDTSGVDRSRAPALAGGATWDCPFPREAEIDDIDNAVVTLRVRVSRDGSVEDVDIERDPGSGFGREALRCARKKRWAPGLNAAGNPAAMTSRVNVRFTRSN